MSLAGQRPLISGTTFYEPLALGPIDFKAVHEGGRKLFIAYDPTGLHTNAVAVSPEVLPVISLIDGRRGAKELRHAYAMRTGMILADAEVRSLLEAFAEAGLLEGRRLDEMRREANGKFRAQSKRLAVLAGEAYPKEAAAARAALADCFRRPEKGAPEGLAGIVLPHIDLRRAPVSYGLAAAALANNPADLYVFIGTGHHLGRSALALSSVPYDTPLGIVESDRSAVSLLAGSLGDEAFIEEYTHAREHSLEFAALVLRYALDEGAAARSVFVLVGSIFAGERLNEAVLERLDALSDALRRLLLERGLRGRVLFIAAADLSHVGRRFGGEAIGADEDLAWLERADREDLAAFCSSAGSGAFLERFRHDNNARNVCGISAMYVVRKVLDGASAEVASYEQSPEPETQSAVTMASVLLK